MNCFTCWYSTELDAPSMSPSGDDVHHVMYRAGAPALFLGTAEPNRQDPPSSHSKPLRSRTRRRLSRTSQAPGVSAALRNHPPNFCSAAKKQPKSSLLNVTKTKINKDQDCKVHHSQIMRFHSISIVFIT